VKPKAAMLTTTEDDFIQSLTFDAAKRRKNSDGITIRENRFYNKPALELQTPKEK
jgi:hypothetical protein